MKTYIIGLKIKGHPGAVTVYADAMSISSHGAITLSAGGKTTHIFAHRSWAYVEVKQ
jgi:hypothetical protein